MEQKQFTYLHILLTPSKHTKLVLLLPKSKEALELGKKEERRGPELLMSHFKFGFS